MASTRKRAVIHEGPEAAWRFEHSLSRILSVPREELDKREAKYQESRKNKPRPGPKPTKK
jgi:hypothetical protein